MVSEEYQNVCRQCVPQECDLFKKGLCRGIVDEGEFAVAKASMRILECIAKKEAKA